MKYITSLFCLLLATTMFPLSSKSLTVYTWVDKNGIAHFSYLEPSMNTNYQSFELKEVKPSEKENAPVEALATQNEQQSLTNEQITAEIDQMAQRRKEYCEKAQYNLDILQNYPQVKQVNSKGEAAFITDKQKAEFKKQAMARIDAFCD